MKKGTGGRNTAAHYADPPFRFENSCLSIERVRFATKIIFVLSNVFASFRK
jgi:hypothetical protein